MYFTRYPKIIAKTWRGNKTYFDKTVENVSPHNILVLQIIAIYFFLFKVQAEAEQFATSAMAEHSDSEDEDMS